MTQCQQLQYTHNTLAIAHIASHTVPSHTLLFLTVCVRVENLSDFKVSLSIPHDYFKQNITVRSHLHVFGRMAWKVLRTWYDLLVIKGVSTAMAIYYTT